MKITKSQLQKLIKEAISLPSQKWRGNPNAALNDYMTAEQEVSDDYLMGVHGGTGPATVQLAKSQMHDYSPAGNEAYMASRGIESMWDTDAKKITRHKGHETNHPIVHQLKELLSDAYVLVSNDQEWRHYITGRGQDPAGRAVLVTMGSDDNSVVFKARDATSRDKYFVYRG